jgi:hypothetical protein
MMGILTVIGKIVALKPVELAISKLLGKVFGQGSGSSKVSLGLSFAAVLAAIIAIAKLVDPGLGDILSGNEGTLIAFVGVVQAVVMYYRKEDVL